MKRCTSNIAFSRSKNLKPRRTLIHSAIIGIRDMVGFHGGSVSELKEAFKEAVDFYLESCEKSGRQPNKTFSGKFVVRVDSSLHGEIVAAAVAGKSLSKWVADTLECVSMPSIDLFGECSHSCKRMIFHC